MIDGETTVGELKALVLAFSRERDWERFHHPKDLGIALASEVGELLDHFRYRPDDEIRGQLEEEPTRRQVAHELADCLWVLLRLADVCGVDLASSLDEKVRLAGLKYPVDRSFGRPDKYTAYRDAAEGEGWAMNVIVVACNSWHLGFLGAYGNSWIETPHLDRLAAEGVVFDHHFPENLTTLPTRRSWWTGRYGFPDPENGWTPLRHDEVILPDLLWNQGIRSALISDVPMLREAGQGFGRGWDDVIWIRGQGYDPLIPAGDPRAGRVRIASEPGLRLPDKDDPDFDLWKGRWEQFLRNRAVLKTDSEENTGVARTVRAAIDWLDRRKDDPTPFLLWLDLFSPHGPWDPPQPYRDQYAAAEPDEFEAGEEGDLVEDDDDSTLEEVRVLIDVPAGAVGDVLSEEELLRLRRTYAGMATLVDRKLGDLFDALRATGRFDDSLVVFTSDQGEPLGEHGYVRRFRPWLYEELIHTPLIVRMPRGESGGIRRQAIVQSVDLFPTILSALGLTPGDAVHGRDLLPIIRGDQTKVRDYACLGMDVEEFAIRTHQWHLIVPVEVDPDDPPRKPELYRKPEDRWDQNDVAAENPEVADQLELTLRRFVEAVGRDALDHPPAIRDVNPENRTERIES